MFEEFKKFALKGNVVDLAIAVIIGAAFGKIVTSLVDDIFMPVIGWATNGLDFSNHFIALSSSVHSLNYVDAKKEGAVIGYGQFLNVAITFVIVAWILFMLVRGMNKLRREEPKDEKPAEAPADIKLLTEIRDLLASRAAP